MQEAEFQSLSAGWMQTVEKFLGNNLVKTFIKANMQKLIFCKLSLSWQKHWIVVSCCGLCSLMENHYLFKTIVDFSIASYEYKRKFNRMILPLAQLKEYIL